MFISIDKSAVKPVYQQIRDGIVALIEGGSLSPGDKLPGSRELAEQLGISRKTVISAYIELAAEGWVETNPGSSTYVLDRDPAQHALQRRGLLASDAGKAARARKSAPVSAMDWEPYRIKGDYFRIPAYELSWKGPDEWICFSRAIPDPRLFPFERIKKVASQMLWDPKAYFFDYGHPQGFPPLLEQLSLRLSKEGIDTSDSSQNGLAICSGFQLALNLLLTILIKPGQAVAVEDPTFNSILNLLEARGIPHHGVPMEADGMDVSYLDRLATKHKLGAIVTIPTLHNPTGICMSREKRLALIALAQRHGIPVIEDYWSLFTSMDGKGEPSLKTLDEGGHVIQIGSFSKSFLPGTRVAWVVLQERLGSEFTRAKRALDRSDSFFLQTLVYEFIRKGYFDLHLRKVERIYKARRELMGELLRTHMPTEASWQQPSGGLTYWVKLPEGLSGEALLAEAVTQGIDFAPGSYFSVGHKDTNHIRLAFSTLTQPQLRQGIRRLGIAAAKLMNSSSSGRGNKGRTK
jgi:DNA-binding transcriptional MocR family regulator